MTINIFLSLYIKKHDFRPCSANFREVAYVPLPRATCDTSGIDGNVAVSQ